MAKNYYNVYGHIICFETDIYDEIADNKVEGISDIKIRFDRVNFPKDNLENFEVIEDSIYLFEENVAKIKIHKGQEIIIEPADGADKKKFLPHNLGIPLAILLYQKGFLVLHGSAIETNDVAVGFIGNSGEGKSTITFALYKDGFNFFTDEFMVIKLDDSGIPLVFPGFPMLKLSKGLISNFKNYFKDSNLLAPDSDKYSYKIDKRFKKVPLQLKHIYVIKKGEKTSINEMKIQDALMSLIENNYCIGLKKSYDTLILSLSANLIKNIKIKELEINHSFKKLNEIVKLIQTDIV